MYTKKEVVVHRYVTILFWLIILMHISQIKRFEKIFKLVFQWFLAQTANILLTMDVHWIISITCTDVDLYRIWSHSEARLTALIADILKSKSTRYVTHNSSSYFYRNLGALQTLRYAWDVPLIAVPPWQRKVVCVTFGNLQDALACTGLSVQNSIHPALTCFEQVIALSFDP